MVSDDNLRLVCATSHRFSLLASQCDLHKMADHPVIDFSGLTEEEREQVLTWATGGLADVPAVIAKYIEECRC